MLTLIFRRAFAKFIRNVAGNAHLSIRLLYINLINLSSCYKNFNKKLALLFRQFKA